MLQTIAVFGGSGFLGRYVVQCLAKKGYRVKVAVRHPERAAFLKPLGEVGQIVPLFAPLTHEEYVRKTLIGTDAVINLVGILVERSGQSFEKIHHQGAAQLAKISTELGIKKFIHLSALGADTQAKSRYSCSKGKGEKAVLENFPRATIIRPSLIFGTEEHFFHQFAAMALFSPVLPLLCEGKTKFQPVYVGDVAEAIVQSLEDNRFAGKILELGGPDIITLKKMIDLMLRTIGRPRYLLPLNSTLSRWMGSIMQCLPGAPLTADQVRMLENDTIVQDHALGFKAFGIIPQALEPHLSVFLERYRARD